MYLIFDTETTGLPQNWKAPLTDFNNWPRCVQLAWQTHDKEGKLVEVKNYIIKPEGYDIPFNAEKACYFLTLAWNANPSDPALSARVSQALYFQAMFIEEDPSVKDSLFYQGYHVAITAIKNQPNFQTHFNESPGDSAIKWLSLLSEAPIEWVPGMFWWAVNEAKYLNNKPIMERLNKRELLEVIMHRIISLEPSYFYGGPYRFFGAFYTRIPGIELSQSKSYFDQAISAFPNYLGSQVYLAEFYHQKSGNREQFHDVLQKVIQFDTSILPEIIPENTYYQSRAKSLLEQENILFE